MLEKGCKHDEFPRSVPRGQQAEHRCIGDSFWVAAINIADEDRLALFRTLHVCKFRREDARLTGEAFDDSVEKLMHEFAGVFCAALESSTQYITLCDDVVEVEDQAAFLPLPETPFDACKKASTTADRLSLVRFDCNDYSVPVRWAHYPVVVKGYAKKLLTCRREIIIAEHRRLWDKEDISFNPIHYLELLERKPGALDHARPLAEWKLPECFWPGFRPRRRRRWVWAENSGSSLSSGKSGSTAKRLLSTGFPHSTYYTLV